MISVKDVMLRPHMFLVVYDRQIDAGNMFLNFATAAVCLGAQCKTEFAIYFSVRGSHFFASMNGASLNYNHLGLMNGLDIASVADTHSLDNLSEFGFRALTSLQTINWLSASSIFTIHNGNEHYSWFFASANLIEKRQRPLENLRNLNTLSVSFTLNDEIFEHTILPLHRARRTISIWPNLRQGEIDDLKSRMRHTWNVLSDYDYSVKINFNRVSLTDG